MSDRMLKRYVEQGAFGKYLHIRQSTPLEKRDIIRMNRDTLHSAAITWFADAFATRRDSTRPVSGRAKAMYTGGS
jgi:hypothetical protein